MGEERNWEQEYERILMAGLEAGNVSVLPDGSEQRRHPRFRIAGGQIYVAEQVPHQVADLSVGGLAFYSQREFPVGQMLTVSLRQILAIQAEVLGCDRIDGADAPAPFKVRCRVQDEDYGMRFLVLALDMEGRSR